MLDEQCIFCVISGFRRELDETCAFLGYNTANSDNFLSTFRDNSLSRLQWSRTHYLSFLTPEGGNDRLSRNVGKKLSLLAE